jgi:hypothetical protein
MKGETVSQPAVQPLPSVRIGPHTVSRLVAGANPILGYSYMGGLVAKFMNDYFTLDRTVELINHCWDLGINTWQSSWHEKVDKTLTRVREGGRAIQWILLTSLPSPDDAKALEDIVRRHKPIAVVHHGGVTDKLWREGKINQVRDFAKRVKDLGVLAGTSAHNPDVLCYVEDGGWDLDLYMACFYRLTRTPEELHGMLGEVPLWGDFLPSDPVRMCEVIRAVKRPCLAFKILGGGRLADRPEGTQAAFEFAFRNIKRTDGVIVGMFPRFGDHAAEAAAFTRRFALPSQ